MAKIEEELLAFWKGHSIYDKLREKTSQGRPFYFCDGPPYVTGQIHAGTAWGKCVKDSIIRQRRMLGFNVRDQPGFDTHGLPIEVKVEKELGISNKKEIEGRIGVAKFIAECKKFATGYIALNTSQFQRCGIWMDWENPYVTFHNNYIESTWRTIAAAESKGLLSEGLYVVPHCGRCETTLANYELEYGEQEDPAIFVKFKVKGADSTYLVIWTTTPWTLVSNMAVMAHPTYAYVKAKVGEEVWIVSKERLEPLLSLLGESASVIGEVSGKKLDGMEYEHPLAHRISKQYARKVVLSDEYVTGGDGSGLVHCAPGHGPEDFIVGKRFGIEIFSPVDGAANFTQEAGAYALKPVRSTNPAIIEDLEAAGALIHASKISHRYPHCWRCKTPLIFIATHQWFISITKLKERMLEEINTSCRFHPDFAKTRFRDFVQSAPDWCISRQRYWGIPLPIWICNKCNARKIVSSKAEFPNPNIDLHRPEIDHVKFTCPCGGEMSRVPDVLDVWFDSGNAVWAQLPEGEQWGRNGVQADFIVEGKDQTRGWFYSLLGSGIVLNNEIPYRNLLMHGFFVDEKGNKMSKSEGNFVPLEEMIGKYGADAFRLWGLSATTWDDVRFNWKDLEEASRTIGILYNMGVWMERFYPRGKKLALDEKKMEPEDKWVASRCENLLKAVSNSFENFEPHYGLVALRQFLVEDVSRFYLKRLKQRIAEGKNEEAGLATYYDVLMRSTIMLSPYLPFISEHLWRTCFLANEKTESVALCTWPSVRPSIENPLLEQQMSHIREIANSAANARSKADLKLRWPIEEVLICTESIEVSNAAEKLSGVLEGMSNARKIKLTTKKHSTYEVKIAHSKIGAAFKADSPAVQAALAKLKPEEIVAGLKAQTGLVLEGKFKITSDMVSVEEIAAGYSLAHFENGTVYIKSEMKPELYREAMAREIMRRIQMMRKEMLLVEADKVNVWITGDKELASAAEHEKKLVANAVNASELNFAAYHGKGGLAKEWEIEEGTVKITVEKA